MDSAEAQYVYTRATSPTELAEVEILRRPNGSETATALAREEIQFDGYGRVWKERRLMPGIGWSTRETRYNAMGWKAQVSEYTTGTPTHWTQYLDYDPFGRPGTIRPPDGSAHDVQFSYTGVRLVSRTTQVGTARAGDGTILESPSVTTEEYDRQGRLWKVTEPSGSGGADVTTVYSYDVGNRLAQASTTAGQATQVRKFTYDNRGFLISEQHPEKGPNGNGLVNYFNYDARGHAQRRQDTPNDLTYEYDRAERLVTVRETSTERLLKEFSYATANGAGDWRNGKLATASRYNYLSNVPSDRIFADGFERGDLSAWSSVGGKSLEELGDFTVKIVQTNVYGGRGGRVSQRDLQAIINGTPAESFRQSWTYNDLGAVETIGYPECSFIECQADAASPRTVTLDYTRGYLTAVPGYASSITYHASGLVNQIAHTNGVTLTQVKDPNSMVRPASITAKKGATTLWSTGDYRYDGAGNITAIGTSWFLYDPVNRLSSATLYTGTTGGGTAKLRTYTYDPFGNIQGIGGTSGRATPTKSETNRLEGTAVYDSAGNLTSWNGNYYEYDAFNQMSRIHTGGEEWLYLYTADGERVWHFRLGGNPRIDRWTLRDLSGKVLREYLGTEYVWTVAEDYIYRGDVLLAAETPQGPKHFHLDHLGTPRLITNTAGQGSAYHVYYPFGEEITGFDQDSERMKFTGHERDLGNQAGSGDDMDYMHARHYNPLTARFTTVDPGPQQISRRPHTWNRYSYTAGRPLIAIDRTGEELVFVGERQHLRTIETIVNSELSTHKFSINRKGVARLKSRKSQMSTPTSESHLYDVLSTAISSEKTTNITVSARSQTVIGNIQTGDIDIADIAIFGPENPASAASLFGHEVSEQFELQVMGQSSAKAHTAATVDESMISGFVRTGSEERYVPFGYIVSITYENDEGKKIIVRIGIDANGNVVSVRRIPA